MANTTELLSDDEQRTTTNQTGLESGVGHTSFPLTADRTVSEQVVQAVATVTGNSITEIEPLNNAVDADALNNLFSKKLDGNMRRGGYLAFEYANHFVTVFASGRIEVADAV